MQANQVCSFLGRRFGQNARATMRRPQSNMMYNSYAMRQAKESWQSPLPRFTVIECLMPPSSSRRSFDRSSREKMYKMTSNLAKQRSSAEYWPSRPCVCWNARPPPHAATSILIVCELYWTDIVRRTALTRDAKFLFPYLRKDGSYLIRVARKARIFQIL